MTRTEATNEQRVILTKISWQKFEQLLVELGSERSTYFTYDHGRLELMTPGDEHERTSKLVESLLLLMADEMKLPVQVRRGELLQRSELQQAIEPQVCCYLRPPPANPDNPSGLKILPSPNLILEVALNATVLDKLPLYANFGISEVWRYEAAGEKKQTARKLLIYQLQGDHYEPSQQSLIFPFLTAATVLQFLDQSDTLGLMPALQLLREWLHKQPTGAG